MLRNKPQSAAVFASISERTSFMSSGSTHGRFIQKAKFRRYTLQFFETTRRTVVAMEACPGEAFVHQHQARSIPDQNLDPVSSFRSEHEGRAAERVETSPITGTRTAAAWASGASDSYTVRKGSSPIKTTSSTRSRLPKRRQGRQCASSRLSQKPRLIFRRFTASETKSFRCDPRNSNPPGNW